MKRRDGNGDPRPPRTAHPDAEAPVPMLPPAGATDAADESFVGRVRRSIQRRLFAASVVEFCILGPALAVLEFVVAVIAFWRGDGPTAPRRKEVTE
ncbi:MAG: hypothetical protein OXP70_02900 [Acidobacteriota bacterium]|nr:hypothetical protein [Acidobacteriota bacterium]